jgi:hypothetical protein
MFCKLFFSSETLKLLWQKVSWDGGGNGDGNVVAGDGQVI